MEIKLSNDYLKDISKLRNQKLLNKLADLYEFILKIESVSEIPDFKKLKGSKTAYRIRINDYRLGIYLDADTIILARFLHRKDIYNEFP